MRKSNIYTQEKQTFFIQGSPQLSFPEIPLGIRFQRVGPSVMTTSLLNGQV